MTQITYEFGFRFRDSETEDAFELSVEAPEDEADEVVLRLLRQVSREYPQACFEGLQYRRIDE